MRGDRERLLDMAQAIEEIGKHLVPSLDEFESDRLRQVWVSHHLQIMGEAARTLSEAFRQQHSEVPWSRIAALRHVLVHQYFDIDVRALWAVVQQDLPKVRAQIAQLLEEPGDD